jgi:hypothetical protein
VDLVGDDKVDAVGVAGFLGRMGTGSMLTAWSESARTQMLFMLT